VSMIHMHDFLTLSAVVIHFMKVWIIQTNEYTDMLLTFVENKMTKRLIRSSLKLTQMPMAC